MNVFRLVLVILILFFARSAFAHEWYTGTHPMPDGTNRNCCGGDDCKSYPYRSNNGETSFEVNILGRWFPVDPRLVVEEPSPDGELHACCRSSGGQCDSSYSKSIIEGGGTPLFYCFWIPRGSS